MQRERNGFTLFSSRVCNSATVASKRKGEPRLLRNVAEYIVVSFKERVGTVSKKKMLPCRASKHINLITVTAAIVHSVIIFKHTLHCVAVQNESDF